MSNVITMLTTIDNPFDPFTQYESWYAWDFQKGYHTPSFLARVANTSNDLSEPDHSAAITAAINEIVHENVLGIYRKVTREQKIAS